MVARIAFKQRSRWFSPSEPEGYSGAGGCPLGQLETFWWQGGWPSAAAGLNQLP